MDRISPDQGRVPARVELAHLNLHPSWGMVIGGLRRDVKGRWELPWTWVKVDESPVEAARRVIDEVFRLREVLHEPELVGVRSTPNPDASVSVLYAAFGLVPNTVREWSGFQQVVGWDDLVGETFSAGSALEGVGDAITEMAAKRPVLARALAASRSFDVFTIAELREVYEKVLGFEVDEANFRKKVLASTGFIEEISVEEAEELETTLPNGPGKPPQRYRCGSATRLEPPVRFERKSS
ncbi:MAG: NrtR DNA-binding winged helix domain-containing protein [Actinomycetota bacterium]